MSKKASQRKCLTADGASSSVLFNIHPVYYFTA